MKLNMRQLITLLLMPAVVALVHLGAFTGSAQLADPSGKIDPVVLETLQVQSEAAVFISLAPPADGMVGTNPTEMQQNTLVRQSAVLSVLTPAEFSVTYQYSTIPALAGRVTATGVQKLANHPDVVSVADDAEVSADLAESVPLIGADQLHLGLGGLDGAGVNVAVVDSGIVTDHPDLADDLLGEKCFMEAVIEEWGEDPDVHCGPPEHPAEADPYKYHGAHVSGIITSDGDNDILPPGVAPKAGVFAYKVVDYNGHTEASDVAAALNDIVDPDTYPRQQNIDFVNLSLGWGQYEPGDCPTEYQTFDYVFNYLYLYGTVTFASSGNDTNKAAIKYPACQPWVVSVGATYDADQSPIYCDATAASDQVVCLSDSSDDLDLLAPGATILSASGDDDLKSVQLGTSMASPHAVGVAALLKQARPDITPQELVQVLKDTGVPVTDDYDPNNVRTIPRVDAHAAALAVGGMDSSGVYHVLQEMVPAGQDPGQYLHCLADVERDGDDLTARAYCYVDIPGVLVNPEAGPESGSGDGFPYVAPPPPYGDVDDQHAVLTGSVDEGQNTIRLSGCFEDRDGQAALGNVYVEWAQQQWEPPDLPSGEGTVSMWTLQTTENCLNGTLTGDPLDGVLQSVRLGDEGVGHDFDHDNCPDENELLDNATQGGLRDPFNHWDYFNPTHDGLNRADDQLAVISQYFCDEGTCPTYTKNTDRTAVVGANPWNFGPPNGQQRVDDILAAVKSYFHDCAGGSWIDDDDYAAEEE